jgi:DNA-binding transcriptional regulator YiaG
MVHCIPKVLQFLGYTPFESTEDKIQNKIKSFREERGLRQRKFANLLNVDQSTIRDWENGKHKPNKKLFKYFSTLLKK